MEVPANIPPSCPTNFFNHENCLLKWKTPRKMVDRKPMGGEGAEAKESRLDKLLNGAFPPREWNENGINWFQMISHKPVKRLDIIKLSQRLDKMMTDLNARDNGICDVRRKLHTDLLDELTRQIIIQDEPLGLLLLKVRDDLTMTILCYKALFENSVQYGLKKALEAEQGRRELQDVINNLQEEKERLEAEKKNAMKSVHEKERKAVAEKDLLEALHIEKMEHYEKTNRALQELLDTVIITKM
nr:33 kDa inner dynein arm light chain, axonemal [Halyomorpha halys]